MPRRNRWWTAKALLTAPLLFAEPVSAATDTFEVGVAKTDITPSELSNLNPFGGGSFTAVHDPIFARALYLKSGTDAALLMSFDLPEVGDMAAFRRRIEREAGIKYDHIMLAATHDHSAPRLGGVSPGTRAQQPSAESFRYSDQVYTKVIDAIKSAVRSAVPARFGSGRGDAFINVNRDLYTPGKGWGQGYNSDGVSDHAVRVLRFDTMAGKPLAIVFDYGVHSTITFGMKEVTGDLAGAAERFVEENADGAIGMFVMGAGGEQVPRVQRLRSGPPGPPTANEKALAYRAMDAQGLVLGAEALRVAWGIKELTPSVRIGASARESICPTKPTVAQMATIAQDMSPTVTLKLGVLTLNDTAIASVSGEVVTPIEQRLLRESPLANTVLATLVNDRIGYIVNDAAYDTPMFEVNGSPAARGCAEDAIVSGLVGMIREQIK